MSDKSAPVAYDGGSFRDPAGFVFKYKNTIYRQVNSSGKADFDYFVSSGLYDELAGLGLIVAHSEVELSNIPSDDKRYKLLKPTPVPFISYPYEWTFSQLKAAALLTLQIQKIALSRGMILKDASAYNVQFIGRRPVFIDSLSFRVYETGSPWDGYKQFCEHFISPLAVASFGATDVIKMQRAFIDGMPLSTAAKLLPARAKLSKGLMMHLYLHAAGQRKYNKSYDDAASARAVSKLAMTGLIASLEKAINKLKPAKQATQWGDYYSGTNYSDAAFAAKKKIVGRLLAEVKPKPKNVWDIGANDGTFSEIAARSGAYVISFDFDPRTVELNFSRSRDPVLADLILPLSQDLTNPSPALGWAHRERASLEARGPADVILALALVHHLAIGNNLPLAAIADFFSKLGRCLIIEFVPKHDSKTKLLLARRVNMFPEYSVDGFEAAFSKYFGVVKKVPVVGSQRVIYLLKSKKTFA